MKPSARYFLFSGFGFITLFFAFYLSASIFQLTPHGAALASPTSNSVTVTGTVPGCGDGAIQTGESCDGFNLNNQSCFTLGFFGGSLSCNANCTFNTAQCLLTPPPPPPPPGGGGGVGRPPVAPTQVVFSGRAFPRSTVTILKDAQVAATTIADSNANFKVTLSGLLAGSYIFSVYAEDNRGIRSSLLTFHTSVAAGTTVEIGGIFIAPSIAVDKREVRRGDNIAIFGQSAPRSEITIRVNSAEEFYVKTNADRDGIYLYNFDTTPMDMGQHHARSKSALAGAISAFGKAVGFTVGMRNVPWAAAPMFLKGDLNNDGRVNLIDFSIAAYWYKRPIGAEFVAREIERLNGDGRVDLIDFSIMAFYWTG
jgi:hypothetical protein